ncbi:MAG: hypothetical protein LBN93_09985 [Candidatus Symbiothrix sp.]|jgi:hypothetical protein|nr:hypothetical protein [Candidatus Symbiothrix sp.]
MAFKQVNKEEIKDEIVAEIAEIEKKAKTFFGSESWQNVLIFFVFVVLAFCFWLLQYYEKDWGDKSAVPTLVPTQTEEISAPPAASQSKLPQ